MYATIVENQHHRQSWKTGYKLTIHSLDFAIPSHGPKWERKMEIFFKDKHSQVTEMLLLYLFS